MKNEFQQRNNHHRCGEAEPSRSDGRRRSNNKAPPTKTGAGKRGILQKPSSSTTAWRERSSNSDSAVWWSRLSLHSCSAAPMTPHFTLTQERTASKPGGATMQTAIASPRVEIIWAPMGRMLSLQQRGRCAQPPTVCHATPAHLTTRTRAHTHNDKKCARERAARRYCICPTCTDHM